MQHQPVVERVNRASAQAWSAPYHLHLYKQMPQNERQLAGWQAAITEWLSSAQFYLDIANSGYPLYGDSGDMYI